eukprot:TRINITY_DN2763_c0_g1_i8.p1 TRINITY_DN2763_c0_g1~~TRINITY_DN2763_c0_g1_i8.p1  ORF type:complete len:289 (-),score=12.40 TRINITY_DN2763_c0_g1_i8:117-983(-)
MNHLYSGMKPPMLGQPAPPAHPPQGQLRPGTSHHPPPFMSGVPTYYPPPAYHHSKPPPPPPPYDDGSKKRGVPQGDEYKMYEDAFTQRKKLKTGEPLTVAEARKGRFADGHDFEYKMHTEPPHPQILKSETSFKIDAMMRDARRYLNDDSDAPAIFESFEKGELKKITLPKDKDKSGQKKEMGIELSRVIFVPPSSIARKDMEEKIDRIGREISDMRVKLSRDEINLNRFMHEYKKSQMYHDLFTEILHQREQRGLQTQQSICKSRHLIYLDQDKRKTHPKICTSYIY